MVFEIIKGLLALASLTCSIMALVCMLKALSFIKDEKKKNK